MQGFHELSCIINERGEEMNYSFDIDEKVQALVVNYSKTITRVAFTYLKNISDAEDISQEVFLTYLRTQPIFQSVEHEKAWLIRITINKCKNHLKSPWFRNIFPVPEDLSYLPKEEDEALAAVLALDRKYRIPIHLHYYEGYTIEEIAEILDSKVGTVSSWLSRGRKILKKRLEEFL